MTRKGGKNWCCRGAGASLWTEPRVTEAEASDLIPQLHLTSPHSPKLPIPLPPSQVLAITSSYQQSDHREKTRNQTHLFLSFHYIKLTRNKEKLSQPQYCNNRLESV